MTIGAVSRTPGVVVRGINRCEPLEARQLLSGVTAALDADGVLTVRGTAAPEELNIGYRIGRAGQIRVDVLDKYDGVASFSLGDVRRIVVRGGGGDDLIRVASHAFEFQGFDDGYFPFTYGPDIRTAAVRPVYKPVTEFGGHGADTLLGGAGDDVLDGGAGDDIIASYNGNDTVLGRGGDDFLRGGAGRDSLDGGTGQDGLVGDDEDQLRNTGDPFTPNQRDVLTGGLGKDRFYTRDRRREITDFAPGESYEPESMLAAASLR